MEYLVQSRNMSLIKGIVFAQNVYGFVLSWRKSHFWTKMWLTSLPCYKRLDLWHLVCVFQIIKDIDSACYGAVYIVRCTTLPYFDLHLPLLRTLPSWSTQVLALFRPPFTPRCNVPCTHPLSKNDYSSSAVVILSFRTNASLRQIFFYYQVLW